ncbi:MAG: hypothetical protein GX219_08175 [Tissierellia bacterium]|nr:hypothetical protein [Tissierellia bacterium]
MGEWIVQDAYSNYTMNNVGDIDYIGEKVFFSKDYISIAEDFQRKPYYRIRKVKLSDYLMRFYNIEAYEIDLVDSDVIIVSAYGENKLPYEFIKLNEKDLLLYNKGVFLKLSKGRPEVASEEIKENIKIEQIANKRAEMDTHEYKNAILLGIKSNTENNGHQYQTLLISFSDKKINEIFHTESLLRPGRRGLIKLESKKSEKDSIYSERVVIETIGTTNKASENEDTSSVSVILPVIESVDYLGLDYISISRKNYSTGVDDLRVFRVDSSETGNYVDIKDIFGKSVAELVNINYLKEAGEESKFELSNYNFGIRRINGLWKMLARINIMDGTSPYEDLEINMEIPKRIISYNEQSLPWGSIKGAFPDVDDAFSSPEGDILITKQGGQLYVYPVENKIIMDRILLRLELPKGAEVVMSEWITGNLDEILQNFQNLGIKKIDY